MGSVADLVDDASLQAAATPDAYERGREWADAGRVELGRFGPLEVTGTVEACEVTLNAADTRLEWTCTCDPGAELLCAHAVALAAETWRRAP